MLPVSWTNSHHDVTDFVNHGVTSKIQNLEYENGT